MGVSNGFIRPVFELVFFSYRDFKIWSREVKVRNFDSEIVAIDRRRSWYIAFEPLIDRAQRSWNDALRARCD